MKIVSIIRDELLNADSILIEMSIEDYLTIGRRILKNNKYQRRRVKDSKSVYSLLRQDIKALCTIPSLVLAYDGIYNEPQLSLQTSEEDLNRLLSSDNLIILDGLQRTYTMIDASTDLLKTEDVMQRYYKHIIRVEVYVGLSKTGILYRMLTLNTGQNPMSKRHEIEILYSDLLDKPINNIKLVRQVSGEKPEGLDSYAFDDAIEGFNSFIEKDESPLSKNDLLDIVQQLNLLTKCEYNSDIFKEYVVAYNNFVHTIDKRSSSWSFNSDLFKDITSVYGGNIPRFFNKSQTISAFGAAVGTMIAAGHLENLDDAVRIAETVNFEEGVHNSFYQLLKYLQEVRERAKKIGVEQRLFLRMFFCNLLDKTSDSCAHFKASADKAYNEYKEKQWNSNTNQQPQLF